MGGGDICDFDMVGCGLPCSKVSGWLSEVYFLDHFLSLTGFRRDTPLLLHPSPKDSF